MRNYRHIEVRPIAGALGAEIHGVDMAKDIGPEVVGEVRQALLDHLVIFLREQTVTPQQQVAFAKKFGEPIEYPQLKGLPEVPIITPVVKLEHERHNFGGIWHSDTTYLPIPPMGSMLLAREVPPFGGDTMFANQYLAYETLSDGLKQTLNGLLGVSSSSKADVTKTREDALKQAGSGATPKQLSAEHPLVRTHPETGRKALYVNGGLTSYINGIPRDESDGILRYLYRHMANPLFQCRFRWQENSIAFWDNRCVQHHAMWDYYPQHRHGHRVTVKGDRPFYRA